MSIAIEKASALLSKFPAMKVDMGKLKSTEATLAAAGVVGTVAAVQMFTDWDPIGRCLVFWKQLRAHVSDLFSAGRKCKGGEILTASLFFYSVIFYVIVPKFEMNNTHIVLHPCALNCTLSFYHTLAMID